MLQEHIAFNVGEPVAVAGWYCEHLGLVKVAGSGEAFLLRVLMSLSTTV
jgi:hypothetical protein